jgi:hypothetical protein
VSSLPPDDDRHAARKEWDVGRTTLTTVLTGIDSINVEILVDCASCDAGAAADAGSICELVPVLEIDRAPKIEILVGSGKVYAPARSMWSDQRVIASGCRTIDSEGTEPQERASSRPKLAAMILELE